LNINRSFPSSTCFQVWENLARRDIDRKQHLHFVYTIVVP